MGALLSEKKGGTVEVEEVYYRTQTRQKTQPEFDSHSGNEAASNSFVGLIENIKSD